jgi:thioredoxin 1
MKKIIIPIALLLVVSVFSCCGSKTIKVTPVHKTSSSSTKRTSSNTRTSTNVPDVVILKEEYLDARVIFLPNDDLEAALVKAKAEKKPVFIDFYADWCAPCKVMEDGVFHDYDVADFMNKNAINLKVNIEKGNGAAIKSKMYVSSLPTLLFLDPSGNEIARKEGLPLIAEFKKIMKTAVWKVNNPK